MQWKTPLCDGKCCKRLKHYKYGGICLLLVKEKKGGFPFRLVSLRQCNRPSE